VSNIRKKRKIEKFRIVNYYYDKVIIIKIDLKEKLYSESYLKYK